MVDSGNVNAVLTCVTSHWVNSQYTHEITFTQLSFAVKMFEDNI